MSKFKIYPVIFYHDEENIIVEYPNFPKLNFSSNNSDFSLAYDIAREKLKKTCLKPRPVNIPIRKKGLVHYIVVRDYAEKQVNQKVEIPLWLEKQARKKGIIFSSLLKEALVKELKEIKSGR